MQQPLEAVAAELFADEEVAVAHRVVIPFEEPDDVEEQRRVKVEEPGPASRDSRERS